MKLVATVTDVAGVVHAGASPESRSAIVEIDDRYLPEIIKQYLEDKQKAQNSETYMSFQYLTFSILDKS